MTIRSYRIRPVMMQDQECDGVWTDGVVAWIGSVQAYNFYGGKRATVVLPLTDSSGAYIPAPSGWHSLIIEPLEPEAVHTNS